MCAFFAMEITFTIKISLSVDEAEEIISKIIDNTSSGSTSDLPAVDLTYNNYLLLLEGLLAKQLDVQTYLPDILIVPFRQMLKGT